MDRIMVLLAGWCPPTVVDMEQSDNIIEVVLEMIDRLHHHCPDLSIDTDYIENILLPIIDVEEVIINDEWKKYPSRHVIKFLTRSRRTVASNPVGGHLLHPLTKLIDQKEVTLRSRRQKYSTPFPATMNTIDFISSSPYAQKLNEILARRFGS